MTLNLKFGLPLIGWIVTLIAMRNCPLTKEEMVNVQKAHCREKVAAQSEFYKEQLHKPIPRAERVCRPFGFS